MNVAMRTPLVLALTLAARGRLADPAQATTPVTPRSGRVSSIADNNGTLLAETRGGPVLLIVAWDATIRGLQGLLELADIRVGDLVEWSGDDGQSVAMVDRLTILPAGTR